MVKNVTMTVEEDLLNKARAKAASQRKTLNLLFREWIRQYVAAAEGRAEDYERLMKKLGGVRAGRSFSRDEMNER